MFVMGIIQQASKFLILKNYLSKIMPQSWNMAAGKMPFPAPINNFTLKCEFPYGRVQEGESLEIALARELQEQLGIVVKNSSLLGVHNNIYAFRVLEFTCDIISKESDFAWVAPDELLKCDMLEICEPFVQLLQKSK